MTVTIKPIVEAQYIPATVTAMYTAVNCKTVIDKFTATNTTAANVLVTVHLVAVNGTPGAPNTITALRAIAPGETYTFPEMVGQVIAPGGSIHATAGVADSLNIRVSGREIT